MTKIISIGFFDKIIIVVMGQRFLVWNAIICVYDLVTIAYTMG